VLHQLERGDGLAELPSRLCIAQRRVVAVHGGADNAPGDAVAGLVQARQRGLQPARARQPRAVGQAHLVEDQFARVRGAQAELAVDRVRGEARRAALDQEGR
jgi:hypothetical protein